MQIFKRLKINKKRFGQNLIEAAFIIPILVVLTLILLEVGLFWQEANAITALNAEINANIANLDYNHLEMGKACPAVDKNEPKSAYSILKSKDSIISLNNPEYTITPGEGQEPFVVYEIKAPDINVKGKLTPQIILWVDCTNPFENGITTKIQFYHKTLILKASIPRYDGEPAIEVIPEGVFFESPNINTLRHY